MEGITFWFVLKIIMWIACGMFAVSLVGVLLWVLVVIVSVWLMERNKKKLLRR